MNNILQLFHSDSEHTKETVENIGVCSSNLKFLRLYGQSLSMLSTSPFFSSQLFWSKWEAQTKILSTVKNGQRGFPSTVFEPYYSELADFVATDPFIFGKNFYCNICKQGHFPVLRNNLLPGDIILFGSNLDDGFVLDTLFVVKAYHDYKVNEIENYKETFNSVFYDVALRPLKRVRKISEKLVSVGETASHTSLWSNDDEDNLPANMTYRIYEAAMYSDRDRFGGIFSYAPCLSDKIGVLGFTRPHIVIPNIISDTQSHGLKVTRVTNAAKIWHSITNQVLSNNLSLLIATDLPEKV